MAMNKKWNNDVFDQKLKEMKPNWRRFGNVINGHDSVEVLCESNHIKHIQPSKIHKIKECNQCNLDKIRIAQGNKFIEILKENNYTALFISIDYKNNNTEMKTKCPNGQLFKVSFNRFTIKYGKRCKCEKCILMQEKQRKPYYRNKEECMTELKEKGFLMDDCEFKGLKYFVSGTWVDCEHRETLKPSNIIYKNSKCKECRNWSMEKFQKYLNENTTGYTIVNKKVKFHMKKPIKLICNNNHEFTGYPQNMIYFDYRCPDCTTENKSGKNSQFFDESLTEEERNARNQKNYKKWVKVVKKRDDKKCELCNSNSKIAAHHFYSFREYESIRFDVDNGITLCQECHRDFHDQYGYNNNNIDQFIDYCSEKYSFLINDLLQVKGRLISRL